MFFFVCFVFCIFFLCICHGFFMLLPFLWACIMSQVSPNFLVKIRIILWAQILLLSPKARVTSVKSILCCKSTGTLGFFLKWSRPRSNGNFSVSSQLMHQAGCCKCFFCYCRSPDFKKSNRSNQKIWIGTIIGWLLLVVRSLFVVRRNAGYNRLIPL